MVLFIAGLIGTGKTTLAKAISERFQVPYYDVDAIKKEVYPLDPDFQRNLKEGIPFSDQTRQKVFKRVMDDFVTLSKVSPHLVIDETFHNASLRQPVFEAADRLFGGHAVIWVKARDETVKHRLEADRREGHLLKDPFAMYLSFKKAFEPFEEAAIEFDNDGPLKDSIPELCEAVRVSGLLPI